MLRILKRVVIFSSGLISALSISAQSNEWMDPKVNQVNREPMHANFFAYESAELAGKGVKEASSGFLSLNGKWRFGWVKDATDRPMDFFKPEFDDKAWGLMNVPGLWELNGYGDPVYVNIGWAWKDDYKPNPPIPPFKNNHVGSYRKEVLIPEGWKGKDVFIHFGAVTSNLYVWVNGRYVGYSEDSKLEAEFNITKYLKEGQNLIAFQAFRWCDGTYLEDQDMFRFSGVNRGCYLYARDARRIDDIKIKSTLDAAYKNGLLDIVFDVSKQAAGGVVETALYDAGGKMIVSDKLKVAGDKVIYNAKIGGPKKWTAETPNLYRLAILLKDAAGNIIEAIEHKVGFRTVEVKNAQLLVNGQPVLMKGVNRHEMDPLTGSYVTKERMVQDIRVMKENNINAIRTCHYPDDNYFYELCDQYGMYVVAEANLESHGMTAPGNKNPLASDPAFTQMHLERNQRNVQRNRNHPSVIIWSLGNEAGDGENFTKCFSWIKQEDPTRPVQYEGTKKGKNTDIFCPMYYTFDDCKKYVESNPQRPLIQCEYVHAMGNSAGVLKEYWSLVRKYPAFQGGFIWDFVDQSPRRKRPDGGYYYAFGGDYNPYDVSDSTFVNNGLIGPDRQRHPHMTEVKRIYQSIWIDSVDVAGNEMEIRNENFFRDLSGYYVEWSVTLAGKVMETGVLTNINVKPQSKIRMKLPFNKTVYDNMPGELLFNMSFKLKRLENLLPAGYEVARNQHVIRPHSFGSLNEFGTGLAANDKDSLWVDDSNANYLLLRSNSIAIDFSKKNGFLSRYEYAGRSFIERGTGLRPNFWRAAIDNDRGAKLTAVYAAWKNPVLKLVSLGYKNENGIIHVDAHYEYATVSATIIMAYDVSVTGEVKVTQKMVADANAKVSDMFRFGMELKMPVEYQHIQYYGRGPGENYADRKSGTDLGWYRQLVSEQAYPYSRVQETGTKTDIRWWKQLDIDGYGLEFVSQKVYSISALPYSIESMDPSNYSSPQHQYRLQKQNYVNVCIDLMQMGVGGENSWGRLPYPEYRIPYKDYEFTFLIKPVKSDF